MKLTPPGFIEGDFLNVLLLSLLSPSSLGFNTSDNDAMDLLLQQGHGILSKLWNKGNNTLRKIIRKRVTEVLAKVCIFLLEL